MFDAVKKNGSKESGKGRYVKDGSAKDVNVREKIEKGNVETENAETVIDNVVDVEALPNRIVRSVKRKDVKSWKK